MVVVRGTWLGSPGNVVTSAFIFTHTQLFHRHTPTVMRNASTYHASKFMIEPPPSPLSFLPSPYRVNPCLLLLEELALWILVASQVPRPMRLQLRFVNTAIERANTDKDIATLNLGSYPMVRSGLEWAS